MGAFVVVPEENEKSEPFSNRKQVRIFLVWWARVDSNHRSVTQQIYSLSPLATREHAHILLLRLCEKLRSSQRLFIIAGRNEKCKPFFEFFKSFFQRKEKTIGV